MPAAYTVEQKKEKHLEQVRDTQQRGSTERKRNNFNGTEGKLKLGNTINGYHMHIFNDTPGRIQTAIDGGYEFVTPEEVGGVKENVVSRNTDLGEKVRFLVGKADDGGPMYAYVLKIKEEWYQEDQKTMQIKNDAVDSAIKSGKNVKAGDSPDGFYNAGIKYDN